MVRTKADRVPGKAVGGKAPAKAMKSTPVKKVAGTSKGKNYSGGNPYHPRETPVWQKPITCFLNQDSSKDCTYPSTSQENEDQNTSEETGDESD
ncbi:PCNA-associated factor [Megalopta genalis]|uniref:PCNA-associated factor n=1 Tax=Megalopta genalis TaxID=115081 RepID=UPI0014433542|nr:PCNA-associated factor-like [Megalopta genalis]XP_033320973.1 PCNA-associated factor-like [Megalopta genalis]